MIAVHKAGDDFVVAEDGTWLPGVFATEEAARMAVHLAPDTLQALSNRLSHERAITIEDIERCVIP